MIQPANISATFLEDGQQTPEQVAAQLIDFFVGAQTSLDIAIYDCALSGAVAATVGDALRACVARGVAVRVAYFGGPHQNPTVPPPAGSSAGFLQPLGVPIESISGYAALMHHKYVIRDAGTPAAAVWTGSTNWTLDAWSREENCILCLPSAQLAALYRADFDEMWTKGKLENTGKYDGGTTSLLYEGQPVPVQVWFSPGLGQQMAHAVAAAISAARRQIIVASPVLTVGTILGALADVVHKGQVPVRGVFDATQMQQVRGQWGQDQRASWKIAAFDAIASGAHLAGKRSTPYSPTAVHDYMHVKMIVVDDQVFAGSYNFSHSGEENAENLLSFQSRALAELCTAFIDRLIARYGTQAP